MTRLLRITKESLEAGRDTRSRFSLWNPSERAQPCQHRDVTLQASRTVGGYLCCGSHQSVSLAQHTPLPRSSRPRSPRKVPPGLDGWPGAGLRGSLSLYTSSTPSLNQASGAQRMDVTFHRTVTKHAQRTWHLQGKHLDPKLCQRFFTDLLFQVH